MAGVVRYKTPYGSGCIKRCTRPKVDSPWEATGRGHQSDHDFPLEIHDNKVRDSHALLFFYFLVSKCRAMTRQRCVARSYAIGCTRLSIVDSCRGCRCVLCEQDFYQALYTQSQAQFDTYVAGGTILNNYAHIFDVSLFVFPVLFCIVCLRF